VGSGHQLCDGGAPTGTCRGEHWIKGLGTDSSLGVTRKCWRVGQGRFKIWRDPGVRPHLQDRRLPGNTGVAITRQESRSKGLSPWQSWVAGTPSIAEDGRDPQRPQTTSPHLEQSHRRRLRTSSSGAAIARGDGGPPASRLTSPAQQRTRRMLATTATTK